APVAVPAGHPPQVRPGRQGAVVDRVHGTRPSWPPGRVLPGGRHLEAPAPAVHDPGDRAVPPDLPDRDREGREPARPRHRRQRNPGGERRWLTSPSSIRTPRRSWTPLTRTPTCSCSTAATRPSRAARAGAGREPPASPPSSPTG